MWIILYLSISAVCSVWFARVIANNDDAFGSDATGRGAADLIGFLASFFWPLVLAVGVVYYYAFRKPEAT